MFTDSFPFIGHHNNFAFNGYYFIENMIGGLFILSPICFCNFYIFKLHKFEEDISLRNFIKTLGLVALSITIASICMAGSNQRYLVDYSWIWILSAILIFLSIYTKLKRRRC